jgi:class 3 adenylate cyclase/TolB-like protein
MKPSKPAGARSLAAVLFTDMVGYSALMQRDEALAMRLLELHFDMVRRLLAAYAGREIKTIGDSFLIEFGSALDAVRFGANLQQRQAAYNRAAPPERRFELRIGIHIGDVEHRGGDVFGDGVNIAARLEPLSPPGGLAVSRNVREAVDSSLHAPFVSSGPRALKNIAAPVEVFVLPAEATAQVEAAPEGAVRRAGRTRALKWPLLAGAAGLALLALGLLLYRHAPSLLAQPLADKSVAVLPLSSFGGSADDQAFTDGLHDSILTQLARIKDLKVISRTSVLGYRGTQRNLREIGRELGVSALVEGSVQRAGNRLRVNAQLIDAATDRHLWAGDYDRELSDVFAVQADLALQIAQAVRANLTPEEKAQITRQPTANAQAYQLYLAALPTLSNPDFTLEIATRALQQLDTAVRLDPQFALAYALIAEIDFRLHNETVDLSPERFEHGRAAMETALRLQPDLAEGHIAKAIWKYRNWDLAGSLAELDLAEALEPGNVGVLYWRTVDLDVLNHTRESVEVLRKAAVIDPRNDQVLSELESDLVALNLFDEALDLNRRRLALDPDSFEIKLEEASLLAAWRGDYTALKGLFDAAQPGFDPNCAVSYGRFRMAMREGAYAEAVRQAGGCTAGDWDINGNKLPTSLSIGYALKLDGKPEPARRALAAAVDYMRNKAKAHADLPLVPAQLFLTLAVAGEHAAAEAQARQVMGPVCSKSLICMADAGLIVAEGYAQLGDSTAALDQLERIIQLPDGPTAYQLLDDEYLKPLLGLPRFKKLVADNIPPRPRLNTPES